MLFVEMIIGVTGLPCAGTDSFGKVLEEKGFIWFSYSDVLRDEAKKRGIEITRRSLQDLGDELRKTQGSGVLSKLLIKKMKRNSQNCSNFSKRSLKRQNLAHLEAANFANETIQTSLKKEKNYVIGNIRNPGEVEILRARKDFVLVKVEASEETRFKRMLARNRENDPATFEEFKKLEAKDLGVGQESHGQQHGRVFEMADYSIDTNCTIEELRERVLKLVEKITEG
jgi:dephospho-CoA kinase